MPRGNRYVHRLLLGYCVRLTRCPRSIQLRSELLIIDDGDIANESECRSG